MFLEHPHSSLEEEKKKNSLIKESPNATPSKKMTK